MLEAELAKGLEHLRLIGLPGSHDDPPHGKWAYAELSKALDERLRGGLRQEGLLARLGVEGDRSVLRDDTIEEALLGKHAL